MFDRFTDRAKKMMSFARRRAQELNHEYIGTEHLLLGLIQEGTGVAATVLGGLDIDLEKLRVEVEKIVQAGPTAVTKTQLPFTPPAKNVLEISMEEASLLGHNHLGTEHILLGLIGEEKGIAAQVLTLLGASQKVVRKGVLDYLGESGSSEDPPLVP